MSQHDFNIANQGFPATRADINNAFQAIASNSSGPTAPSTTFANQWWYDTTNDKMYLRNAADSAWIEVATVDQANNEWQITTGVVQAKDGDGLVLKTDDGTARISIADSGLVTVSSGLTVAGNISVDGGTIKLDGNYPVGTGNVALGDTALDDASLSGNYNTAVGSGALTSNTTGSTNTVIGRAALGTNTAGGDNTASGHVALANNSTGSFNTALGSQSLLSNTTASQNTAVGYQSLYTNTAGENMAAFGYQALYSSNTTGSVNNNAFGFGSLYSTSTGTSNTSMGHVSMYSNTTGSSNVAMGTQALYSNTTASNNTAVGYQAGYNTTTGVNNTFMGEKSGYLNTTGDRSSYYGSLAGNAATGRANTFIGCDAGYLVTTGASNTILGRYSGNQGGLDIRTSSNNIVLSDGDGNPRMHIDDGGRNYVTANSATFWSFAVDNTNNASGNGTYRSLMGANANNTSSYHLVANSSGDKMYIYGNGNIVNVNNSYGALSDQKLKENIVDSGSQWDDVKALTVRKYSMKTDELDAPNMLGVIAQEVEAAGMGGLVFESPDRDDDGNVLETSTKQVNYSILYMKAVKALQEAMDRIETLEAKVTALEAN